MSGLTKAQTAVQDAAKNPQVTHVGFTQAQEEAIAEAKLSPPQNTAVPYVEQAGASVTCTMGEWMGEPDTYAYAWDMDGAAVGDGSSVLTLLAEDVGKIVSCVVSATNEHGTTAAPVSNAVVIA
jgi:hypothetical protein